MKLFDKHRCPCCKKHRFEEIGKYEICPICGWEDDPTQRRNHSYSGGANKLCLKEYRKNIRGGKKI